MILLGIVCFRIYLSNTKYSSEEIYDLVQKGINGMQNLQNVCIVRENASGVGKYYYKGNKFKLARYKK